VINDAAGNDLYEEIALKKRASSDAPLCTP